MEKLIYYLDSKECTYINDHKVQQEIRNKTESGLTTLIGGLNDLNDLI